METLKDARRSDGATTGTSLTDHAVVSVPVGAGVFECLADPTRREMLFLLAALGPQPVGKLSEPFAMSRQAAAKHISVLRECGLIQVVHRGRQNLCLLVPEKLGDVRVWLDRLTDHWEERARAYKESTGSA